MKNTVLSENKRAFWIYRELDNHEKISYNELEKIIVKEKEKMSQRIFRENLKLLVDSNLVLRLPDSSSNRVYYSVKKEFVESEKKVIEGIKSMIKRYWKLLDKFKKQVDNMHPETIGLNASYFYRMILYTEFLVIYWYKPYYNKNSEWKLIKKDIEELKHQMYHIMLSSNGESNGMIFNVLVNLFSELEQDSLHSLEEMLSSSKN